MHARRLLKEKFDRGPGVCYRFVEAAMREAVGVELVVSAPEYWRTGAFWAPTVLAADGLS